VKNIANQSTFSIKTPVDHRYKNPVCYTCKSPIEDPTYRFVIVKDRNMKHELLSFHYFFPCWDVNYVCKDLIGYEIFKLGFSCDASILENPKSVNNLRKNYELWDL